MVHAAIKRVTQAARAVGKPICAMAGSTADAAALQALGVTAFIVASDQGFLRQAAVKALTDFAALAA
jgi:staphyloferrin B biosynthesis citrate synthase